MDKVTFAFMVFTGNRGVIHKLCKGIDVEIVDTYVNVVEYLRHFMGIIVKTEKTVGSYTRRLLHIHKYNSVTYVS